MDLVHNVSTWNSSAFTEVFMPFHQARSSDFFNKLSLIEPEMGSTGVFFAMKSKSSLIQPEMGNTAVFLAMQTVFHSTLINMLLISLEISS